jgi:hypothetical protein
LFENQEYLFEKVCRETLNWSLLNFVEFNDRFSEKNLSKSPVSDPFYGFRNDYKNLLHNSDIAVKELEIIESIS